MSWFWNGAGEGFDNVHVLAWDWGCFEGLLWGCRGFMMPLSWHEAEEVWVMPQC